MKKSKMVRVPVSIRGLTQRINRRWEGGGKKLMACRSNRMRDRLGDWYVVNGAGVLETHVDLRELGKRVGALEEYEELIED